MEPRNDVPFVNDGLVNICRNGNNVRAVNKRLARRLMNENWPLPRGAAEKIH